MTDPTPKSVNDACDWKRRQDEQTEGLSREELIQFFRTAADEVEARLGLNLSTRPASDRRRPAPRR